MFLMFDCYKFVFSKQNTAKLPFMSAFTIPLCNGEFMILFDNLHSVFAALIFVALVGLFIIEEILFWKARLKMSRTIVF